MYHTIVQFGSRVRVLLFLCDEDERWVLETRPESIAGDGKAAKKQMWFDLRSACGCLWTFLFCKSCLDHILFYYSESLAWLVEEVCPSLWREVIDVVRRLSKVMWWYWITSSMISMCWPDCGRSFYHQYQWSWSLFDVGMYKGCTFCSFSFSVTLPFS